MVLFNLVDGLETDIDNTKGKQFEYYLVVNLKGLSMQTSQRWSYESKLKWNQQMIMPIYSNYSDIEFELKK